MTVASLWKALDRAECAKQIGVEDLLDHEQILQNRNPWNYNNLKVKPPTLAVDLSIWICEALGSSAIADNHSDPAMHLIYARTVKLLSLGVKLIGVLEGKQRINGGDHDQLRKRRSGTPFWRACQRCEELYKHVGVPTIRAKAEGEALCALLNKRGMVDGVISNDGDCFLFGAKVLYTKFSNENLQKGAIMRYDADSLVACLDDDDSDEVLARLRRDSTAMDMVKLSQSDLITFAVLTGSDVAGTGLPKVGCRKALRFIKKCQIDNPMRVDTAAFNEIVSWSKVAELWNRVEQSAYKGKKCSLCCHPGSKSSHIKNGCELCGTAPGEACFQLSQGGKFRKSLREKALAMDPRFDPESVAHVYHNPNDNQIPFILVNMTSERIAMKCPDLKGLLRSSLILRGRSAAESQSYVLQSLSHLIAKAMISQVRRLPEQFQSRPLNMMSNNEDGLSPVKIVRTITRTGLSCYELLWRIRTSATDNRENSDDGYEFSTIEEQTTVRKCFPELVENYALNEKEELKQGSAEQEKRKAFLEAFTTKEGSNERNRGRSTIRDGRLRRKCLQASKISRRRSKRESQEHANTTKHSSNKHLESTGAAIGDDAAKLLQASNSDAFDKGKHQTLQIDCTSTVSSLSWDSWDQCNIKTSNIQNFQRSRIAVQHESPYRASLTPAHLYFLDSQTRLDHRPFEGRRSSEWQAYVSEKENVHCDPTYLDSGTGAPITGDSDLFRQLGPRSPVPTCKRSPSVKKSKVVIPGKTPPVSKDVPLYTGSGLEHLEHAAHILYRLDANDVFLDQALRPVADIPNLDQSYFEDFTLCEPHSIVPCSGIYDDEYRQQHRHGPSLPSVDQPGFALDGSVRSPSFKGLSVPSIRSAHAFSPVRGFSEFSQSVQQDKAKCIQRRGVNSSFNTLSYHWLKPAFFDYSPHQRIDCRLSTDEDEIIEVAMAKLEQKRNLAKSEQMLQELVWQGNMNY